MAKLSARGRKELVRFKKTETRNDAYHQGAVITTTLAVMDDGRILRKISWKDYPGSWGLWKKLKKEFKKGEKATLEDFVNVIASLEKNGYVRVK